MELSEMPSNKQAERDFFVVADGGPDVRFGPILCNWILFFLAGMVLTRLLRYAKFGISSTGNE